MNLNDKNLAVLMDEISISETPNTDTKNISTNIRVGTEQGTRTLENEQLMQTFQEFANLND